MPWFAVNTKPHCEARAARHLARQGFAPWLPEVRTTRCHARKTETVATALFPGYLFVAFDPDARPWHAINGTVGVRRLISQGDRPLPVPDAFMDELRARQGADGFFAIPADVLRPGDRVRFRAGPFADSVGTLLKADDNDRVWLLLDILGRVVTTAASRRDIVAAA
jgi:transcriptional antiterminator RfaH